MSSIRRLYEIKAKAILLKKTFLMKLSIKMEFISMMVTKKNKRVYPENIDITSNGLKSNKNKCTDIICTGIFLVFILCLIGVSIFAYKNGNPA